MDAATAVLEFWFGSPDDPAYQRPRPQWFVKDERFDAAIRARFGALVERALAGDTAHWLTRPLRPLPALAQVIVLDQFTRNAFRGTARAFAGDAQALRTARLLVSSGADRQLSAVQRQFAYLPFEHAEDLGTQRTAVQLFTQLAADEPSMAEALAWAERHLSVIERFGRFPHRNAALGRVSSAEETVFLQAAGARF